VRVDSRSARNERFRKTQQPPRPGCPLVYTGKQTGPACGPARLWVGGWRRTKAREKATARPRALTGRDLTHDRIEESLLTCTEPEGRVAVGWARGWVGGWVGGWEEKEGGWAGDWACGAGAAALDEPVALVDRLHPRSVHSVRNGLRHLQPARRQPPREPQPVRAERRCDADHGQTVERRSTRPDVREPAWGAHGPACCTEQRPLAAARGKPLGGRLGVRGRRGNR
jgi:hypothetical protein